MGKETEQETGAGLKRAFGMREAVTITVGTVIGVGLFTEGAGMVGEMGPAIILATLAALVISIYPALLYAEMGAALPYAGGTYQYASFGLGRPWGMLAGWNFIISLVAVTGGEALAFSFYFKTLFAAFGIDVPIPDNILGAVVILAFTFASVRGVKITGRLQNGFMFFFWGVALIWFLTMIPNVSLPTFVHAPDFLTDMTPLGFVGCVCIIWWCFAGFETCCAMGEEIKYPQINIPRALKLAPFVVFAVNGLFQWYLAGITPLDSLPALSAADAPFAEAMMSAGVVGLPLALLAAGIAFGGDFSTLNASIAVPPRYLFTMARDGAMPRVFAKVHTKYRTPYVSIIVLGVLSLLMVATNSIDYIASVSLFGDLFYYVIGIVAAFFLRRRMPQIKRPYKVPGIMVGAPVSALIYLFMMTQLDTEAFVTGLVWCVLGLAIFAICRKAYGHEGSMQPSVKQIEAEEVEPPQAERVKMDREYLVWKIVVAAACVITCLLYLVPFLLG